VGEEIYQKLPQKKSPGPQLSGNDISRLSRRAMEPKKRSLKNLKSKRKMSQLERLPTELLEKVYLFAMNINLPRASPIIGGKLSSEIIYLKTIAAAFNYTWQFWGDVEEIHGVESREGTYLHTRSQFPNTSFQVSELRVPLALFINSPFLERYTFLSMGATAGFTEGEVYLATGKQCCGPSHLYVEYSNIYYQL
jgi:hypothetical protein